MSLEIPKDQGGKSPDVHSPKIQSIVAEVKNATGEALPAPRLSFRRRKLIENHEELEFNEKTLKILDDLCLSFFRLTTGWFDEIILIKRQEKDVRAVYDFSLRDQSKEGISPEEFVQLVQIGNELSVGDWTWVNTAEGSSFDMVGKISSDYLICVNNTNASIDQLEGKYPNRIFEEVKPVIERMIALLKLVLNP